MKVCKNIMFATICFAGSMQTNDVIVALDLASLLPKQISEKAKKHVHEYVEKHRANIITTLKNMIGLNENGEAIFRIPLEDKHHTMHLLKQLPSDSKINLADNAGNTMPCKISDLKNELAAAIKEQHKSLEQAAKKIQHHYRTHAKNKRIADAKEKIRNRLYLTKDGETFSIRLRDKNKKTELEELLLEIPRNQIIKLTTDDGNHSKAYLSQQIYADLASRDDFDDEDIR